MLLRSPALKTTKTAPKRVTLIIHLPNLQNLVIAIHKIRPLHHTIPLGLSILVVPPPRLRFGVQIIEVLSVVPA